MNITKHNGFKFLDFLVVDEKEIKKYNPIAGSFAVIQCKGKVLMVYNKWRKQWELPAGQREGDETAKECAIRELYEETGQDITDLRFLGLLKLANSFSGDIKYNPVYYASIDHLQPIVENEEIAKIKLWNTNDKIGVIDEIDLKLIDFI